MDYGFYVACLRFMARRTDAETPDIATMMADLEEAAACIEAKGVLVVENLRLRSTARALAGVAGVLQKHILPETVAAGDATHEARVRWMIDTSMALVANLTVRAECLTEDDPSSVFETELPPPPDVASVKH